MNEVRALHLKQLQVLFLTDGQDGELDRTKEASAELRKELMIKEVFSKFSVIGIGDHDAGFLG